MWHFLFPAGSSPGEPDELFADQHAVLVKAGFTTSLCSDRAIAAVQPLDNIPPGSRVVYRGWMLTGEEYARLVQAIERAGGTPLTSVEQYLCAHHLPNWYPLLKDYTPETHVLSADANLVAELREIGWDAYFIKDFVKSLKTKRGSIVRDPSEAPALVAELKEYRGRIEGGICVRKVEEFAENSEQRYFVLRGACYAANGESPPEPVKICAERIPSPFFSVDVARRKDGELRIVEIGDGQVSDLVGWRPEDFLRLWSNTDAND